MSDTAPPRQRGLHAEAVLVFVTFLWGLSFPWMKTWQDTARDCPGGPLLSGLTLIALRMLLASVCVALLQPRLLRDANRCERGVGALVGLVFGAGFVLQVWGIAYTKPSLSAFFTCLCSAWAPLIGWVFLGLRVSALTFVGLAIGLAGTLFFVEDDWLLGFGETLTLLASLFFAGQVLLLDRLGRTIQPAHMTPAFFAATGVVTAVVGLSVAAATCGLTVWFNWLMTMLRSENIAIILLLLALLPTFVAFHLMNQFQPRIPASRAALIYLLEPVFTSIISVSRGYETVTLNLLLGGGLILVGNLLVEGAVWLRTPVQE